MTIDRRPRHLPAARRPRRGDHQVLRRDVGLSWGLSIVAADLHRPAVHAAAVAHRDPLDAPHAAGRAGDQGGPGEVQGRPRAPAARDDRVLQGERGQPARLLLPVPAPDPVLHRRLLAPARRHLPTGRRVERRRGQFPLRPGHPDPARGRREVGADRPVHHHHVLTFLYTTATTQTTTGPQQYIFLALPLLFAPVIASQPAGLAIYWITTNLWSLGQQVVVQKVMPMPIPPTPEERKKAEPPPPPPRKKKKRR